MESRLAASGPVSISTVSGTGEAVPIRVAAPRLGNAPPSSTRRPDVTLASAPAIADRSHPISGSPGAHARFHAARLRPSDLKPALALLERAGSHAGGRPARAATLFRVLRPMRSAREQREKLPPEYFYNHARLRFLPCRHARAACDPRDARHATGAGLKSLRSKT